MMQTTELGDLRKIAKEQAKRLEELEELVKQNKHTIQGLAKSEARYLEDREALVEHIRNGGCSTRARRDRVAELVGA